MCRDPSGCWVRPAESAMNWSPMSTKAIREPMRPRSRTSSTSCSKKAMAEPTSSTSTATWLIPISRGSARSPPGVAERQCHFELVDGLHRPVHGPDRPLPEHARPRGARLERSARLPQRERHRQSVLVHEQVARLHAFEPFELAGRVLEAADDFVDPLRRYLVPRQPCVHRSPL